MIAAARTFLCVEDGGVRFALDVAYVASLEEGRDDVPALAQVAGFSSAPEGSDVGRVIHLSAGTTSARVRVCVVHGLHAVEPADVLALPRLVTRACAPLDALICTPGGAWLAVCARALCRLLPDACERREADAVDEATPLSHEVTP